MKWGYTWRERVGLPHCTYLTRWVAWLGIFSIRIHYWTASDDQDYPHDHEWWFSTFVLWGGYTDVSYTDGVQHVDKLRVGSYRYRRAEYQHTVRVTRPTVTLLITGLPIRKFGFWVKGKFIQARRYFFKYGHHPCIEGEERVRTQKGRPG